MDEQEEFMDEQEMIEMNLVFEVQNHVPNGRGPVEPLELFNPPDEQQRFNARHLYRSFFVQLGLVFCGIILFLLVRFLHIGFFSDN